MKRNCHTLDNRGKVNERVKAPASRNRLQQLHWSHVQRVAQFDDVQQSDLAFTSLDSSNVVPVKVRKFCESLLGSDAEVIAPAFGSVLRGST